MKRILATICLLAVSAAHAATTQDYLVQMSPQVKGAKHQLFSVLPLGSRVQELGFQNWARVEIPKSAMRSFSINSLKSMPGVAYVQPNYKIRMLEQPSITALRAQIAQAVQSGNDDDCPIPGMCGGDGGGGGFPGGGGVPQDNPEIPAPSNPNTGDDPLFNSQWGMVDIGTQKAWGESKGRSNVIVAVIDTGVDYTHEDLKENLWRNPGETGTDAQGRDKAKNGVDDDNNGYIDDQIGWDFGANDNKPFDMTVSLMDMLTKGGNPGHGTHCAGNVAARGFNGKGIAGVAPNVTIMAIRFLTEKGEGTTDGAIKSILYAVNNGAQISSNSWGSEGEDANDPENKALRDAVQYAQDHGSLFIAAAGNGRQSNPMSQPAGYDNDTDSKPGVPASYDHNIIVSVAAIDKSNNLGTFSNWGHRTVDIGAPGVAVFSTMVGNRYSDKVIDIMNVTWDGTSMATPHVAGAAALYLSARPNATWQQIKDALIKSALPIPALNNKVVSNGKLNVENMLRY